MRLALLALIAAATLSHPAQADEVFVRNRPVKNAVSQYGVLWIPTSELGAYFSSSEMKRVKVDPNGVSVDGMPASNLTTVDGKPYCAVEGVAERLGFRKVPNPQLKSIDWFPPAPPAGSDQASFHKKGLTELPDARSELEYNQRPTWKKDEDKDANAQKGRASFSGKGLGEQGQNSGPNWHEDNDSSSSTRSSSSSGKGKASFSGKGLDDSP